MTLEPTTCISQLQYIQWGSLIYYISTVIKVIVHNTVFYNPITDRWLVTVYMKCIYSVVFLKLCLNRCFQAQIQTKMQTLTGTHTHIHSVVKVLSYPERAAAKYDPSLAVNDWWCVFESLWVCVCVCVLILPHNLSSFSTDKSSLLVV